MRVLQQIAVVDTHTGGEPTRVWVGGMLNLPGESVREQRGWLQSQHDQLRTFLMQEPRGHRGMCGAMSVRPCDPGADLGVVFMDNHRYMDMCGHATMGYITAMVEMGSLGSPPGEHRVVMETPAGLVHVRYVVGTDGVQEVSFRNVVAFHCGSYEVELDRIGTVTVDVAYGGNVFALVDCRQLGVPVKPATLPRLKALATAVLRAVDRQAEVRHPRTGEPLRPTWVELYDEQSNPPRNVVIGAPRDGGSGEVLPADKVDRSPCGTGLSAKMALLHSRGELAVGEPYVYQSIIGSRFRGTVVDVVADGVVPEIAGRAYVMGIAHLMATEEDLFGRGFLLPEG